MLYWPRSVCTLIVYAGHWKEIIEWSGEVDDFALRKLKCQKCDEAWDILVARGCEDRDLTFAFLLRLSCWVLRAR